MRFLLTGVETYNKGAELMLYAILQEIERKFPDSTVYIEKDRVAQGAGYIKTCLKIRTIENPLNRLIVAFHIQGILRRLHLPQIRTYTIVPKVDYLIDGSGLHFTDQMTDERHTEYWRRLFGQVRKFNSKIIFLPQGFGPIEKPSTKESVLQLFRNADLVYAREMVSYKYLCAIEGIDRKKLKVCTDFTSLVNGTFPMQYEHLKNAVCVIPNMQMVNKGVVTLNDYISYLQTIIESVSETGKKVYLLNHEGYGDEQLLLLCRERINDHIEIVTNLNALDTKGLISSAYLVITSRFHGLASALNSCVPSLSTSWSHKYECLFQDYGLDVHTLSIKNVSADIEKIKEFLDPMRNDEIRKALFEHLPQIKKQARDMWGTIWTL